MLKNQKVKIKSKNMTRDLLLATNGESRANY